MNFGQVVKAFVQRLVDVVNTGVTSYLIKLSLISPSINSSSSITVDCLILWALLIGLILFLTHLQNKLYYSCSSHFPYAIRYKLYLCLCDVAFSVVKQALEIHP